MEVDGVGVDLLDGSNESLPVGTDCCFKRLNDSASEHDFCGFGLEVEDCRRASSDVDLRIALRGDHGRDPSLELGIALESE